MGQRGAEGERGGNIYDCSLHNIHFKNKITGLLGYKSHTYNSQTQKVQLSGFQYIHRVVQPSLQSVIEISIIPRRNLVSIRSIFPQPPALGNPNLLSVSMDLPPLDI